MDTKNLDFIRKFYGDPLIRRLILEQAENYDYCIGTGKVLLERGWSLPVREVETSKIEELMADGLDIFFPIRCRSDKYLYLIWDIEYFNKKNPHYIFDRKNQRQIFEWMAPTLEIIEDILDAYGIKYVVDVTMSGIHIWSKIAAGSEAFAKLSSEGFILPSLEKKYSQVIPSDKKRVQPVPPELGRAYNCTGKILEFFTHALIKKNKKSNKYKIPVTVSDTPQYDKTFQYSGVSSDLTQYAHPIFMRCIRAICSIHQKSLINGHPDMGPAIDIVKTGKMKYADVLKIMWDVERALKHFRKNYLK